MNILLQWATGTGKTKAALDYVKQAKLRQPKVLVLVAEIAHIKNWKDEIAKWKCKTVMSKSTFCCYSSLHKMTSQKWDFIICDECHHLFSEKRMKAFRQLQYDNIILLSATLTHDNVKMLQSDVKDLMIDKQTLSDCINEGKLKMPDINIVNVQMTEFQTRQYLSFTRRYEMLKIKRFENAAKMAAIKRKRFLANTKTKALTELVSKLRKENKKIVYYCASIDQMIKVSGNINCVSSKHRTDDSIQKFNNGEISELFFCQMGTEGLNLRGIEVAVICQTDAQTRPFIQKIGRVLRNKENPVVYILKSVPYLNQLGTDIVSETIDEKNIRQCLDELQ